MTVVVAQLTDTHLRGVGELTHGFDVGLCLRKAVASIANTPVSVDAVIVTGDLVDRGTPDEYAHFLQAIAPLRMPVYPIPGNHDVAAEFSRAFQSHCGETERGDIAYARSVRELRVVLLDSTVAGADHGTMSKDRVGWLERTLAERPDQPTLLALHHPPFRIGIPSMDAINCREDTALAEVLGRHPQVLSLVCGHAHRSIFTSFAGRPASIAPSPAFAVQLDMDEAAPIRIGVEPPGLHIHIWSPEAGEFGSITTHRLPVSAS